MHLELAKVCVRLALTLSPKDLTLGGYQLLSLCLSVPLCVCLCISVSMGLSVSPCPSVPLCLWLPPASLPLPHPLYECQRSTSVCYSQSTVCFFVID